MEKPVTTLPVFDLEGVRSRLMGDQDLIDMVLAEFLADMPHQLQNLDNSIRSDDREAIKRQAHTIKGSAANVGGMAMHRLAVDLEREVISGDTGTISRLAEDLRNAYGLLETAINRL